MTWNEVSNEERAAWRAMPQTAAALELIKRRLADALQNLIACARDHEELSKVTAKYAGAHEALETVLRALGEDK